ncbi:MAG: hypothetical protein HRT61_21225 [Ekhidna sp.]|nr:hypothetical protein [Ekhidna sp.]
MSTNENYVCPEMHEALIDANLELVKRLEDATNLLDHLHSEAMDWLRSEEYRESKLAQMVGDFLSGNTEN